VKKLLETVSVGGMHVDVMKTERMVKKSCANRRRKRSDNLAKGVFIVNVETEMGKGYKGIADRKINFILSTQLTENWKLRFT
jgi:hypothetical protein